MKKGIFNWFCSGMSTAFSAIWCVLSDMLMVVKVVLTSCFAFCAPNKALLVSQSYMELFSKANPIITVFCRYVIFTTVAETKKFKNSNPEEINKSQCVFINSYFSLIFIIFLIILLCLFPKRDTFQ